MLSAPLLLRDKEEAGREHEDLCPCGGIIEIVKKVRVGHVDGLRKEVSRSGRNMFEDRDVGTKDGIKGWKGDGGVGVVHGIRGAGIRMVGERGSR